VVEVVPASSTVVCDLVDLADELAHSCPGCQVVFACYQDLAFHLLTYFHRSETLFGIDGLGDQTASLHFDAHQLQNVQAFEGAPADIKFEQIFLNLSSACLDAYACGFLGNFSVKIPEAVFEFEKLDHKFATVIEDFLREGIFLAVDPKVGEAWVNR
jgi:hypothetical protein